MSLFLQESQVNPGLASGTKKDAKKGFANDTRWRMAATCLEGVQDDCAAGKSRSQVARRRDVLARRDGRYCGVVGAPCSSALAVARVGVLCRWIDCL